MLARLLNLAGVYLGSEDRLIKATADNPDGHWEHEAIVALNDQILGELGAGWDCPPPVEVDWKRPLASAAVRRKVDTLRREFDGHEPWGWKDPRTSVALPFWLELYPDLKVVVCLRNPLEVAVSLRRRGLTSYTLGLRLWSTYNLRLMASVEPSRRIVTHYDALLTRPRQELERLLRFLELDTAPGAIEKACAAARSDLRHHRFTTRQLLATGVDAEVLSQYVDLCDLAEWSDPNRRIETVGASGEVLHTADHDRARDMSVIDVDALDADLLRQEIEAQRVLVDELRVEVEAGRSALRASRTELDRYERSLADLRAEMQQLEQTRAVERADLHKLQAEAKRSYDRLKRRLFVLVEEAIPRWAPTLMVSRGDEALVSIEDRKISHFPQSKGGVWAGHYPADSEEAVAQLESLHADGARYLVIPDASRWWLEHYRGLAAHLRARARVVVDREDTAIVFELEEPSWRRRLATAVATFESRFGREPAVLDWCSELDLVAALPLCTVFAPPEPSATLPYLDRSVDVVVCPSSADAVAEARRVASRMVVTVRSTQSDRRRGAGWGPAAPAVRIEWIGEPRRRKRR